MKLSVEGHAGDRREGNHTRNDPGNRDLNTGGVNGPKKKYPRNFFEEALGTVVIKG